MDRGRTKWRCWKWIRYPVNAMIGNKVTNDHNKRNCVVTWICKPLCCFSFADEEEWKGPRDDRPNRSKRDPPCPLTQTCSAAITISHQSLYFPDKRKPSYLQNTPISLLIAKIWVVVGKVLSILTGNVPAVLSRLGTRPNGCFVIC